MLSPLLLTRRHAVTAAAWARNLCLPPCPSSRRLTVAATAGSTAPAVVPPVPLCQRPAVHESSVAALLAWRDDVLARVAEIGNTFEQQDNGPSSDELRREISWVLEDVIAEVQEPGHDWCSCNWRTFEVELRCAATQGRNLDGLKLRLRAPVEQLRSLWQRRLENREPFQYLIATAHWREFVLSVSPGVLIPRPETEIFPDLVSQAIAERPQLAAAPWADLGTGSGIVAIGAASVLRKHNQAARVWAVDLSPVAVAHAKYNAQMAGVSQHMDVVQGSWFEPLEHLRGRLGGVLSNPPYIPRVQMAGLQAEVKRHEPWTALDGGPDLGLDSLEVICRDAADMLQPGGFLALETAGNEQAYAVRDLLLRLGGQASTFVRSEVVNDCFGVPRFVVAWKGV